MENFDRELLIQLQDQQYDLYCDYIGNKISKEYYTEEYFRIQDEIEQVKMGGL